MAKTGRKDVVIYAAIEPDDAKRLKRDAKQERRSLSRQVGIAVREYHKANPEAAK